ncbi:Calcium-binding allergen Ole e 8 [Sesamum alatum]|uniref:Calcium-binding allergen Ole e 8 n=1 Tax=Sesamum alatum TaxID=300844 RepID=A0AAE2C9R4_9LAMI|nr:Calcium-binding allergen Ole e 8 [Sesamum alatum]
MAANQDTVSKHSLCLQSMEDVKRVFDRFDANGDGKISSDELGGVIKALGSETSADEVARMMEEIDTDKDGFISLEEFAAFCNAEADPLGGENSEKELREAFELYDQDHDGQISATELHLILTRLGERCSVNDCTGMIKSVDSDGDGFVSFDEFRIMMTKN